MLNFPNSPTAGQVFNNWTYDGAKWVPLTASALPFTDTGRNLVHNAQFNVAQRGTGPWTTDAAFTADRWQSRLTLDTDSVTLVALADTDRSQIGDETATTCWQNVVAGNAGAAAQSYLCQRIENAQRLSGKTVTLSFWAKAASGTPSIGIGWGQHFGTGGSPSADVYGTGVPAGIPIATTWARYSRTLTLPSTAGKTFGTNGGDNTEIDLYFSAGSSNTTYSGIGVQSGTFSLWGVQLEIGSVATPLAKRDPADDLALCQRFYTVIPQAGAMGYGAATYQVQGDVSLPVTMRAAPSVVFANTGYINASGVVLVLSYASHVRWGFAVTTTGNANAATDLLLSADL